MITSFKLSISLSKPSNLKINFVLKFRISWPVSDIAEDSDTSKFPSDDKFYLIVESRLFLISCDVMIIVLTIILIKPIENFR